MPKSDTIAGEIEGIENASKSAGIKPVRPLGKKAAPIFAEIISRKTYAEWTPLAVRDATHLAEIIVDRNEVRNAVKKKRLVQTPSGPKRNPLAIDLFRLESEIRAMQRHLRINPASDAAHPHLVAGKRQAETAGRALQNFVETEDSPFLPFGLGSAPAKQ